jgi:hypothetical protein
VRINREQKLSPEIQGDLPKRNEKMNKQMTPAEIELVKQSFARLAPNKSALVGIESGPWPPPPNIPSAIAPASVTMI